MSKVLIEEQTLYDIGDAIRWKNGQETTYKPGQMAGAIATIRSAHTQDLTVVENGTYTPDDGYDGFSSVIVSTPESVAIVDHITLSVTGGFNGGAVISLIDITDQSVLFTSTGDAPYNTAYTPSDGTFTTSGGQTGNIIITPPTSSTSKLTVTVSMNGNTVIDEDIWYKGHGTGSGNTSYGYDFTKEVGVRSDSTAFITVQGHGSYPKIYTPNLFDGDAFSSFEIDGFSYKSPISTDARFGSDAPSSADGQDGDYYYQYLTNTVYPIRIATTESIGSITTSLVRAGILFRALANEQMSGVAIANNDTPALIEYGTRIGSTCTVLGSLNVPFMPHRLNMISVIPFDTPIDLASGSEYFLAFKNIGSYSYYNYNNLMPDGVELYGSLLSRQTNSEFTYGDSDVERGSTPVIFPCFLGTDGRVTITAQYQKENGAWVRFA